MSIDTHPLPEILFAFVVMVEKIIVSTFRQALSTNIIRENKLKHLLDLGIEQG